MVSIEERRQYNQLSLASLDMSIYEALDRTLQNLSMLDETVNQVTMKLGNEQNQYLERIQKYIERVTVCQQKIAALQDQKKAIVFTSPSQFVMKYAFSTEKKPCLLKEFKQKHEIHQFEGNVGLNLRNDQPQLLELVDQSKIEDAYQTHQLAFGKFHTRSKLPFDNRKLPLKEKSTGLGGMPKHLGCAESLLVLNTNLNPYKRYQMVDNLILDENKYQKRTKPTNDNHMNLQDAPTEINQILIDCKPFECNYKPHTKQVKDTVLIPIKMDLDGIADDYDIDYGENELIQPSANYLKSKDILPDPYLNKTQSSTTSQSTQNQQPTIQQQKEQLLQLQQQQQQQQLQQQEYQTQAIPIPPAPILYMNDTPTPVEIRAAPTLNIPHSSVMNLATPQTAPPQIQDAAPMELSGRDALLDDIRNLKIKLRRTATKIKGQFNSDKQKEETTSFCEAIPKTSQGIDPMKEIIKAVDQRFRSLHPPSRKAQKSRNIVGASENEDESQNSSDQSDQ